MRVIFVAAGPIEWGSSRMRAYWVAPYMQNAEVIQYGQAIPTTADVYIWQKMVNWDVINATPNAQHYWDACDPAWWWEPEEARKIVERVDGVVCSSEALADDFVEWNGGDDLFTHTIPDRLELSHFNRQRQHQDARPVRFIWFGVAVNRIALYGALANLERLAANGYKIELTVMDDRPDVPLRFTDAFPIYNIPWQLHREVEVLSNHDIAILPRYPGAWGKVKSNNKLITAGMCGLASVEGEIYGEMEWMVGSPTARQEEAVSMHRLIQEDFDVRQSAAEWEAILCG